MARVTEAHLEARRQQILDAAFTCFARLGFHKTTMVDIAREAGVSTGLAYRYFNSKEEIIEATWEASHALRVARFQSAQQKASTPEVLAEISEIYVRRLDQPETSSEIRLRAQLFGEALLNPRICEDTRRTWFNVLVIFDEIIRRGQERGEINPDLEARALGRVYLAIHDGLLLQKAIDPEVDFYDISEVLQALHLGKLWMFNGKEVDGNEDAN